MSINCEVKKYVNLKLSTYLLYFSQLFLIFPPGQRRLLDKTAYFLEVTPPVFAFKAATQMGCHSTEVQFLYETPIQSTLNVAYLLPSSPISGHKDAPIEGVII